MQLSPTVYLRCIIGVVCFCVVTGFSVGPYKHTRPYYEARGEVLWEVPTDEKLIALTFDDGPSPSATLQILDLLNQYDAKATFFVVGNRVDKYKELVMRQAAEGHEVANHTFNHTFFYNNTSLEKITNEIVKTKEKIYSVTGQSSNWFRPPGGIINDAVVEVAKQNGYTVVLWSWHQDTNDWKSPGVNKIINKVLNNARNGDIVLLHDYVSGTNQTVEALKVILPELTARGFHMVTVSELVGHRNSKPVRQSPQLTD